jgi:DNA-binding MarR family transcriptional regulator
MNVERAVLPSRLAAHLDLGRPTVSEALKRLTALGFVVRTTSSRDRRATGALLSEKGLRAIREMSVLETTQLRAVLALASRDDRIAIAHGFARLAELCRQLKETRE